MRFKSFCFIFLFASEDATPYFLNISEGFFLVKFSSDNHCRCRRNIMFPPIIQKIASFKIFYIFFRARYVPPCRLISVKQSHKNFLNFPMGQIFIHIDFLYDDPFFFFNFILIENGIQIHIGDDIKKHIQMLEICFSVIAGILLRSESVVLRPNAVQLPTYIYYLRPLGRTLKAHMLKKM